MIIFESTLTTFEASVSFEAARAVAKMGSSLKSIHHKQIKLVQICETHCRWFFKFLSHLNFEIEEKFGQICLNDLVEPW